MEAIYQAALSAVVGTSDNSEKLVPHVWLSEAMDLWNRCVLPKGNLLDEVTTLLGWMNAIIQSVVQHSTAKQHAQGQLQLRSVVLTMIHIFESDLLLSACSTMVDSALSSTERLPKGAWTELWGQQPLLTQHILAIQCTKGILYHLTAAPLDWLPHSSFILKLIISYRGSTDPSLKGATAQILLSPSQHHKAFCQQLLLDDLHAVLLESLKETFPNQINDAIVKLEDILDGLDFPVNKFVLSDGQWNAAAGHQHDWTILLWFLKQRLEKKEPHPPSLLILEKVTAVLNILASPKSSIYETNSILPVSYHNCRSNTRAFWPWQSYLLRQWFVTQKDFLNCNDESKNLLGAVFSQLVTSCHTHDLKNLIKEITAAITNATETERPEILGNIAKLTVQYFLHSPCVGLNLIIDIFKEILESNGNSKAALSFGIAMWNSSSQLTLPPHTLLSTINMPRSAIAAIAIHYMNAEVQKKGESNILSDIYAAISLAWMMLWVITLEQQWYHRSAAVCVIFPVFDLLEQQISHYSTHFDANVC